LAQDIAAFAIHGGLVLIGVTEGPPVELNSVPLQGLPERIEQIARMKVDEGLAVTATPIPARDDPTVGYVAIDVPTSPRAPHMVDRRYSVDCSKLGALGYAPATPFEDGLAASAPGLFHHKQILTPSVHFTVDFVKPTRYGDRLTFNLWTVKAGNTSCELRIEASHQGELRMRVKQVLVFISAASARATPIPPELISRMQRFAIDAGPAPPKQRKPRSR